MEFDAGMERSRKVMSMPARPFQTTTTTTTTKTEYRPGEVADGDSFLCVRLTARRAYAVHHRAAQVLVAPSFSLPPRICCAMLGWVSPSRCVRCAALIAYVPLSRSSTKHMKNAERRTLMMEEMLTQVGRTSLALDTQSYPDTQSDQRIVYVGSEHCLSSSAGGSAVT
eukprot:303852-Rhodomonas_salina.2